MTHQWGEPNPDMDPEGTKGSLTATLVSTAPDDVEPINRMPRQSAVEVGLQQVVRANDGQRNGIGVLEQTVFGPYAPAGFTDFVDVPQR